MSACWPSHNRPLLPLLMAFLVLSACSPAPTPTETDAIITSTLQAASTPQPEESTPAPTAAPEPPAARLAGYLPEAFLQELVLPESWVTTQSLDAALQIESSGGGTVISTWVYALVAPFPSIPDGVSSGILVGLWAGVPPADHPEINTLWLAQDTLDMLIPLLGEPADSTVRVWDQQNLLAQSWEKKSGWAIVPFEQLEPRWKVLAIDGQSPISKEFTLQSYLLSVPITVEAENGNIPEEFQAPPGNWSPKRLTTVALTGVTALVRATGVLMERDGMAYPAEQIGDWLRQADILHINNEVPFARHCPSARLQLNTTELVFCSRVEYIELLEVIGTDVVELNGDHFSDWGPDAVLYTLQLYDERGWGTYGGGANLEDARAPYLVEHNGNRLAFLGCNAKPPGYARASEDEPGAFHCDFTYMQSEIEQLKENGYLPIVTFQHLEYYDYSIHPVLETDFRRMAEAGAVIVSGSQAHQPHGMEFYDGAFLHYGLGNLFFDQYYEGIPTRQATIDRHVFYAGRHISTELLTIEFIDLAQSRPMTTGERQALLEIVFENSNWETLSNNN
jgi:hypothetical protein